MVYIININGKPLMPTNRHGKVRRLLRDKKAKVVKRTPFTIQLLYKTEKEEIQDITLGIDSGSKYIGLSATTKTKELFSGEYELRNDIVDKLSTRRENRRTRRNRLRYREVRFNNRKSTKQKGWLAPSIEHKINSHEKIIEDLHKILPINKVIVEVASFDIQKIKNSEIEGKEYQEGEQLGFWNVREYVLFRDNHECQHCKGKSKDPILNVHHIESRKTGGNAPNNLITLCETCHNVYHKGKIKDLKIKRGQVYRDATFMGIMRWNLYERLKKKYNNIELTYGYITKNKRISLDLPKEHRIDAYCIAGNLDASLSSEYYYYKKVRCHNRQIHKTNKLKGGKLKNNQAPYEVKGFRLFDKVEYQGKEYFIFARRQSGYFDIRNLKGEKVNKGSISYKKINFLERGNGLIIERRVAIPPTSKDGSFLAYILMNNFNIIKKGTPSFNELYEESDIILKLDKYLKKNAKIYKENLVKTDNFLFDYDTNYLYLIDNKYITFLVKISNSEYKFIENNPNMDIDYIIKIINGILDKEI